MNSGQENCPICDKMRLALFGWYESEMCELAKEFSHTLAVLAESHAKGNHNTIDERCAPDADGQVMTA